MRTFRMFAVLALLALATNLVSLPGATAPSRALAAQPQASASTSDGAPVLNPAAPTVSDSGWFALGAGLNGAVHAIAVAGQDIYVGGEFTDAGNISNADYIARWDGTSWHALGSGLNSYVYAIEIHGADVYVGGPFTDAGGNPDADKIARWNIYTSGWYSLDTGSVGYFLIDDIAVIDPYVYVAGQFNNAFGNPNADYIVRYNTSTHAWDALGTGLNGVAFALAVDGGNLYVGGDFTAAGGNPANNIARWDGSGWSAVGSGLNDWVYALAMAGTNLYAGGNFTSAGGDASANSIARWDGSWHAIGGTPPANIKSIDLAGTNIYVAGGTYGIHPYRWDGSSWQSMQILSSGHVNKMAVSEQGVYVGGDFWNLAGNPNANRIALWKAMRLLPDSIVYSRYSALGPTREIRLVDANGANDRLLFNGTFPRLSPSRNSVAFLRPGYGTGDPNYGYDLYVRNLATGAEQVVFYNNDYLVGFDWMSDNLHIVFDYFDKIIRIHADGTGWEEVVTTGPDHPGYNDAPVYNSWDPNRALAFHNEYVGILTSDKYGGNVTKVLNTQSLDFWPAWSSDGQWISFLRLPTNNIYGGGNYFKIHPDGTGLTQLTCLSGNANNHLHAVGTWDSQKDHIVAPGTVNGQAGIYAIATDGSGTIMRLPAAYGAQADFVGAIIGDVKNWLHLPLVLR